MPYHSNTNPYYPLTQSSIHPVIVYGCHMQKTHDSPYLCDDNFGCHKEKKEMWVRNWCRGSFRCWGTLVRCESIRGEKKVCSCEIP
jgi:hypothetical protein